ncbi:MAG: tetratricopeptide repeat protein [Promethearchaeota archaeon]
MARVNLKCPKCNTENPIYDEGSDTFVCRNKNCRHKFSSEAIGYYEKPFGIERKDKDDWIDRGDTYFDLKSYEEAIECFEKALDPEFEDAWALKGLSYHDLGNYNEAEKSYDKALELNGNDEMIWYNKACLEAIRNNKERSIELLREAIELNNYWKKKAEMDKDFNNI